MSDSRSRSRHGFRQMPGRESSPHQPEHSSRARKRDSRRSREPAGRERHVDERRPLPRLPVGAPPTAAHLWGRQDRGRGRGG
eukprot:8425148-Alexandrium_andersonii.AAC.1